MAAVEHITLNNLFGIRFVPTPEILVLQILRRRLQGEPIPASVLCYFEEMDADDFFQLPNYQLRASYYFCRKSSRPYYVNRHLISSPPPVGWTKIEGPTTVVENNAVVGEYATFKKINSNVTVVEYTFQFRSQPEDRKIALYQILSREV